MTVVEQFAFRSAEQLQETYTAVIAHEDMRFDCPKGIFRAEGMPTVGKTLQRLVRDVVEVHIAPYRRRRGML